MATWAVKVPLTLSTAVRIHGSAASRSITAANAGTTDSSMASPNDKAA